jgi:hypothetical protein
MHALLSRRVLSVASPSSVETSSLMVTCLSDPPALFAPVRRYAPPNICRYSHHCCSFAERTKCVPTSWFSRFASEPSVQADACGGRCSTPLAPFEGDVVVTIAGCT